MALLRLDEANYENLLHAQNGNKEQSQQERRTGQSSDPDGGSGPGRCGAHPASQHQPRKQFNPTNATQLLRQQFVADHREFCIVPMIN